MTFGTTEEHAKKFTPGSVHYAYDKNPLYGGKKIGLIVVRSLTLESIMTMPDEDYENEGFKYMEEKGLKIWGKHPRQAFDEWRKGDDDYWVLRFGILSRIKRVLNGENRSQEKGEADKAQVSQAEEKEE